jgi:hypothetical protein
MEGSKLALSNRRLRAVRLAITMGLAMLFLAALLCELREVTPAYADPDLYVDGASGSGMTACTNLVSPCATIGYALDQAEDFDTVPIAGGTSSTSVTATRITNRSAPFIDGILEDIWQDAGAVTLPNPDGGCFTMTHQHYEDTDPSAFTVYYLHDDINLYIAIQTTDDAMVEGSDYDQNSDGLAGMAIERKNDPDNPSVFRLMWYTDTVSPCVSVTTGPPLDRNEMVYDAEWRSALHGTWNDNSDIDNGYVFEFSIPLTDPVTGTLGLGGWTAGEQITTNIVLVDHDSKPSAPYNDPEANFRKCWWGSDGAEDFGIPRWIILSDDDPIGEAGDDKTVTARRINPSVAPVVDGNPDEPIWQQGGKLRFPDSVGGSWTTSQARYNADDPSNYTLYFLHDDIYLYVGVKADDRKIEAAAYDQSSDGLISLVFEEKGGGSDKRYSTFWHELDLWESHPITVTDCDGQEKSPVDLHFHEGPPRYPYDTPHIDWGPIITGIWNDNSGVDAGYAFEYKIPLTETLGVPITETLGGYVAGELIPANIVLIDHDDNPNGKYDECDTHFKRFWWGFDGNEFYPPDENGNPGPRRDIHLEEERYVVLDDVTPYGDDGPSLDPATKAVQYIANNQLEYSGLIRSYQGEMAAHTYDNAVALIALTDCCKPSEARKLANALISVMEMDGNGGFFYDSYNAVDKIVSQGTASGTGPNAWAAFALAYYGKCYNDRNALDAAGKVAQWITNTLYVPDDGGVWGGICHPFEERPGDHSGDLIFPFTSTEQVLDTWHLFRIMGYDSEAESVKSWLTSEGKGWIETDPQIGDPCQQDKRFSTGINSQCGQDRRLFLDPQSWGSIFANMIGEPDKANGAIEAAENHLRVDAEVNGQEISGFGDSCLPKDEVIWYGGTAQMIVAYVYKGDIISASDFLTEMLNIQNSDGSWNHSSKDSHEKYDGGDCGSYESYHSAKPHIGETAWNYFALRDVRDGQGLPYIMDIMPCRIHLPIIMKSRP